jgi:hypothetical protein
MLPELVKVPLMGLNSSALAKGVTKVSTLPNRSSESTLAPPAIRTASCRRSG